MDSVTLLRALGAYLNLPSGAGSLYGCLTNRINHTTMTWALCRGIGYPILRDVSTKTFLKMLNVYGIYRGYNDIT